MKSNNIFIKVTVACLHKQIYNKCLNILKYLLNKIGIMRGLQYAYYLHWFRDFNFNQWKFYDVGGLDFDLGASKKICIYLHLV